MKILHYSLGLPPYRTGGLTKYATDLMLEEKENSEEVILLFPGRINKREIEIKFYKNYKGIKSYELINPLPVPLLNGVKNPREFMKSCDEKVYENFLIENKFDLIHVHSLMGIHIEFFNVCRRMGIKIFYTSHDYYGLCAKVNFINNQSKCCEKRVLDNCIDCNSEGSSLKKITVLQSPLYREVKNLEIIEKIKKIKKKIYKDEKIIEIKKNESDFLVKNHKELIKDYELLNNYYKNIFSLIDLFIFNSTISKSIFNRYIESKDTVLNITHRDIKDNRKIKFFEEKKLNLIYLGELKDYKGAEFILKAMEKIENSEEKDIKLTVYGDYKKMKNANKNINFQGVYKYKDLEDIFNKAHLLIVPSICYETFGFVALEAISYGVPILVSEKVGAKDLINLEKPQGEIISNDLDQFVERIKEINKNREILAMYNRNICEGEFQYTIGDHYKKLKNYFEFSYK